MDVCPEILVLVSAAELAEQNGFSAEKKLEIWRTAVHEILVGLESDNNEKQRALWDVTLNSLLFCSVIRKFCQETERLKLENDVGGFHFEEIFSIMPPCPKEVYYELVSEFQWQKYLLECLHFLSTKEEVCLTFMEDMLAFCYRHGNTGSSNSHVEMVSAITELFLSESFEPAKNLRSSTISRKISGPYMMMGQTLPSFQKKQENDNSERYLAFFNQLFNTIRKSFVEFSPDDFDFTKNSQVVLVTLILGLGYRILSSSRSRCDEANQNFTDWMKESNLFSNKKIKEVSAQFDSISKFCQLSKNLQAKLIAGKTDILDNCEKVIKQLFPSEKEFKTRKMSAVLPESHFPTNQWLCLLHDIFSSQWMNVFQNALENWSGPNEPTIRCLTMDVQFCNIVSNIQVLLSNITDPESACEKTHSNPTITEHNEHENSFTEEVENEADDLEENPQLMENASSIDCLKGTLLETLHLFFECSRKIALKYQTQNVGNGKEDRSEPEDIVSIINGKLEGWEDHLESVLSGFVPPDLSIDCLSLLENNKEYLCTENRICLLFDLLQSSPEEFIPIQKGWKLLLSVFENLPIMVQDDLVARWYTLGYKMVDEDDVDLQRSLTSVFNRLVHAGESEVTMICGLVLQNPRSVLKKALSLAVKNQQQTSLIAQVLHRIPSVCRSYQTVTNGNDESSLLCQILHTFLATSTLQSNEEENLITFLQPCLQRFKNCSVPGHTFTELPVLNPEKCLQVIIMPYINKENMVSQSQPIPCHLALKLYISLTNQELLPELRQPLVLLLCLCEMIQECDQLWDRPFRKDVFKREIITAMSDLPLTIVSESSRQWFRDQVCDLHLSVLLRVRSVLELEEDDDYIQDVAAYLWKPNKESGLCHPHTDAFLFASVDDQYLQMSIQTISELEYTYSQDEVILSLTKILPNLLSSEWIRVIQVCHYLIDTGRLSLNFPSTYTSYLPWFDMNDVQLPLSLVLLLVNCCEVWSQSNVLSHEAWVFVVQHLSNAIKEFCVPFQKSAISHSFLLVQIFCQLCQLLSLLPSGTGDHLYLLMTKILSIYKGVKTDSLTTNQNVSWWTKFSENQDTIMANVVENISSNLTEEKYNLKKQLKDVCI